MRGYCARMGTLRRLAQKLAWRPYRFRRARAMPIDWPHANTGVGPGINEGTARVCTTIPEPSETVTYSLGLDIGELADGYHLIVRSISLTGDNLVVDWALVPEPAEEADLWPEIRYGADVSPRGWNQWRADFDVFERPVPKARQVWFDFFRPYYEWYTHFDRHGQPDDDYLRNRVARLTVDLKTGAAQIER